MDKRLLTDSSFVLVAGNLPTEAWNRLTNRNDYPPGGYLGGKVWDYIAPVLKAQGHSVFAPTLKDEYRYSLSDQIEVVSQLIIDHDLNQIVLVGASYCGMVITGIANQFLNRIRLLVYLDAVLPEPGQSVADIFSLAHFTPAKPIEDSPTYTEKLFFDLNKIRPLPKLYVLCTQSSFASVTALAKQTIDANRESWNYVELPTSHLPMITHPDPLNRLLLETIQK
jgi:pimeloyl-ACP methyl ester carboxylesterase